MPEGGDVGVEGSRRSGALGREGERKQTAVVKGRSGAEGLQGGGLWPAARRPSACFLFLWRPPDVEHVVAPAVQQQEAEGVAQRAGGCAGQAWRVSIRAKLLTRTTATGARCPAAAHGSIATTLHFRLIACSRPAAHTPRRVCRSRCCHCSRCHCLCSPDQHLPQVSCELPINVLLRAGQLQVHVRVNRHKVACREEKSGSRRQAVGGRAAAGQRPPGAVRGPVPLTARIHASHRPCGAAG